MKTFLDNIVTYISSVSSAGAYGALNRQGFSAKPDAQTAVVTDGDGGGVIPLYEHSLQLLVRDTNAQTVAARAEGLHVLFAGTLGRGTWVTTHGLCGNFVPEHGAGPHFQDDAGLYVYTLNYRFRTVKSGM